MSTASAVCMPARSEGFLLFLGGSLSWAGTGGSGLSTAASPEVAAPTSSIVGPAEKTASFVAGSATVLSSAGTSWSQYGPSQTAQTLCRTERGVLL